MLSNFIYAQTKDLFLEHLEAGNILDEAIVFIEDTREIWNHGHYFGGETIDPNIISDLQTAVAQMQAGKLDSSTAESTYAKKTELPSLDGYLTENVANALYVKVSDMQGISTVISNLQTEVSTKADKATTIAGYGITDAVTKDLTGELETAHAQAICGSNYVYALPDDANGDEDDVLLSRQSVKTINGEAIYGIGDISTVHYGVCNSAGTTALKEVTVPTLINIVNGTKLVIKFTNATTTPMASLKVNGGDAQQVKWKLNTPPQNTFDAGTVLEVTFADNVWHITGGYQYEPYVNGLKGGSGYININNYGVCSTAADIANKTVTVSGNFSLITGAQVVVRFTNGNTATTSTLNVNNTGAKNITTGYGKSFNIDAESILTLEYNGTYWVIISSNQMITSGNTNNGYTLQTINSQTSGLAIANGGSVTDSVDGDLYIAHGGTNENAIYCTGGNIVTATGAVKGNIVHNPRTISATTTLDVKDNIVLCRNSSTIDININCDQIIMGQVITIIKSTDANVNVRTLTSSGDNTTRLRVLGASMTTASTSDLSGIGVWNLYCVGAYIYLYKL